MHIVLIIALVVGGSAVVSIALIWLRWREVWTPGLAAKDAREFREEQEKLRLGETFLSREMLHPYLGYVMNPAADEAVWKASGFEKQPVNSFGLVSDQERLPRRAPGKVLIGIFGGSVAQFLAVDHRDALIAAITLSGVFGDRQIELHCLAICGYKQPQQLAELAYFASLGMELDVVINIDGFNEVALHPAENVFKGVCHTFPRAWASRSATRIDPALVFLFGQLAVVQARRASVWNFLSSPSARFVPQLYYVVCLYEGRLRSKKARAIKAIRQFRPAVEGNLNAVLRDETTAVQLVELWCRSSRLMHQICLNNQTRYFQFLQPNQYVPDSKPLSKEEIETAYDPDHPYRSGVLAGYPLLKSEGRALRDKGIAFTDLTMIFANCHETVYSDRCCHFNRLGNEMIANAIAAELARTITIGT